VLRLAADALHGYQASTTCFAAGESQHVGFIWLFIVLGGTKLNMRNDNPKWTIEMPLYSEGLALTKNSLE
jgi:hypothetical protein